jgi:hypothetical protein
MTIQQICVHLRSSAVNILLYLLSSVLKNHREHRGHREKHKTSVLSVSSVVDYPCALISIMVQTCLNSFNNYIHQS